MIEGQLVKEMCLQVISVLVVEDAQAMSLPYPKVVQACLSMVGPQLVWVIL
jgi:hypothetical protein